MAGKLNYEIGAGELKSKHAIESLAKALLGEFLGIFLLNFFACGACTQGNEETKHVLIPLAFGLAVFVSITIFGHVSGGHINPAVTIAMLVTGKISLVRTILYIIVQCLGAIAGTASLKALLDEGYQGSLGNTALAQNVTPLQGLGIEFFLGLVLVFTVFGSCDINKPDSKYTAPLAIGLSVTLGHLGTLKYTGSSMNPARSLGTAVISGGWENHWVYWAGPILGGIVAAIIYSQSLDISSDIVIIETNEKYRTRADERELRKLESGRDYH